MKLDGFYPKNLRPLCCPDRLNKETLILTSTLFLLLLKHTLCISIAGPTPVDWILRINSHSPLRCVSRLISLLLIMAVKRFLDLNTIEMRVNGHAMWLNTGTSLDYDYLMAKNAYRMQGYHLLPRVFVLSERDMLWRAMLFIFLKLYRLWASDRIPLHRLCKARALTKLSSRSVLRNYVLGPLR